MAHVPYEQRWAAARKRFEAATAKHRPKDAKAVAAALNGDAALVKALKAGDAVHRAGTVGDEAAKDLAAAGKDAVKARKAYLAALDKALDEDAASRGDKAAAAACERAMKALAKDLAELEADIGADADRFKAQAGQAEKDAASSERAQKRWEANINGALARAAAGVAKVRAKPTPDTYNELFPALARDLATQLAAAKALDGLRADPDFYRRKLAPWAGQGGDGPPMRVPPDYTARQITDLIKEFATVCKGVVQLVGGR
ncbi:hypothetical protein ABAZ39_19420 (plasmid) [Azospirillum argentinense]|uniref:Uncharacterized protein n=1 Tax=Azospirillum argentinense TaxID=2970906 RepID=A0A2K1G3T4_9PROT|nr:hypothetical protein [Azospirillum argentinense]AIB14098.1 hypothetical protein ABAZ39_19420 [Azospirillum argentinense]EZQ06477.1 hypothetical protein ABAZ39_18680 [Azospirillum argentinense]KAA1055115.1 hypothetical protein FH063_005677 [Azospirillum argentinense]PNQ99443.1 hypothetical protein C1S70_07745 [Azospirillum argentinense]